MCIHFLQRRKPAILPCLQVCMLMNMLVTLMEVHGFGLQIFDIVYLLLDSISEISSMYSLTLCDFICYMCTTFCSSYNLCPLCEIL